MQICFSTKLDGATFATKTDGVSMCTQLEAGPVSMEKLFFGKKYKMAMKREKKCEA